MTQALKFEAALANPVEIIPDLLPRDRVQVPFGGRLYTVFEWKPGMALPYQRCRALALDTETRELVSGGKVVPVMVQVAAHGSSEVLFARPAHFQALMSELDRLNPGAQWVFFNAPFDAKVLGWPCDPLWRIFNEGLMVDLEVRGVLHKLSEGTFMDHMNLEMLTKDLTGIEMLKDKKIQLSFVPDVTLTESQVVYGAQDALATILNWERMSEAIPTEDINMKGSFALTGISDLGIRIDVSECERFDKALLNIQLKQRSLLKLFGIAPNMPEVSDKKVPGANNRKQWLLESLEQQYNIKLKRSKKSGTIVTEKKALDLQLITAGVPVPTWLESLRMFEYARHIRNTYLAHDKVGEDGRVHARFTPMVRTGRTACSGPPLQQYPRDAVKDLDGTSIGEVRGIWIPTDGFYYLASDYNQLELCALSESCYQRFGWSTMGDLINSGVDTHLWFGCVMGEKKNMDFDPDDEDHPVTADLRQRAKAANFGIPGGLGAATFVAYARNYGVNLSLDEAKELIALWFESFPEMREHLKHEVDEYWTLRNIKMYLRQCGLEAPHVRTIQDLEDLLYSKGMSEEQTRKATSNLTMYMVKTITGRVKRNCTYCSAANMEFQAPSADGAKLALWEAYLRGWRVVNFIHDELLQEVSKQMPIPQRMDFVREVEAVMTGSMKRVLPHMTIKVESALMPRWLKKAKPVFDDDGNLLVWMPPEDKLSTQSVKKQVS